MRAPGEGSIYKRKSDGMWIASIVAGRDDEGKMIRRTKAAKSQKEAVANLKELQRHYQTAVYADADKITVAEWLKIWLDTYAAPPAVSESTAAWYNTLTDLYITPAIGNIKLAKLQGLSVQVMLQNMQIYGTSTPPPPPKPEKSPEAVRDTEAVEKAGAGEVAQVQPKTGKGAKKQKAPPKPKPRPKSARTCKAVCDIIGMACRVAVEQGILMRSPIATVKPPQVKPQEKTPLTAAQWDVLLAAAMEAGTDMYATVVLLWATGMRRGELLALRWQDIDAVSQTVSISRAVKINGGKCSIGTPKTDTSVRRLPVPAHVFAALKQHRQQQLQKRMAATEWEDNDLIFANPATGAVYDPRDWSKRYREIAIAAGLPHAGAHALRHDLASRLADAGSPIPAAQYFLGHATPRMMMEVYAHRMAGQDTTIAAQIAAAAPTFLKNNCSSTVAETSVDTDTKQQA